jgi:hypothetical protein
MRLYENFNLYKHIKQIDWKKDILNEPIPQRDLDRFDLLFSEYERDIEYPLSLDRKDTIKYLFFDKKLIRGNRKYLNKIASFKIINGVDSYYYVTLEIVKEVSDSGYMTDQNYKYKCDGYEGVVALYNTIKE